MALEHNPNLLDLVEFPQGTSALVGTVVEMLSRDTLLVETSDNEGVSTGLHPVAVREAKILWQATHQASVHADSQGKIAFEEGLLSLQNGMIEPARGKFAEAFKADPRLAGTLMNLANDLAQEGAFGSALVVYELILRLQPQNASARENLSIARLNRGVDFGRLGNLEQAITEFNAAMLLRPSKTTFDLAQRNLAAGYTRLAVRHSDARLFNEALHFFLFAFQFWPSEDPARNLGLAFASTSALKRSREVPKQEYFLNSFWLGVSYSECLNAYGATLAQIGEISLALEALEAAVEADPKNQLASRNLEIVRGWGDSVPDVPTLSWGVKAVPLDQASLSVH
jgi:tetratricopeptide (TPR) repeat protein